MREYLFTEIAQYVVAKLAITFQGWGPRWTITFFAIVLVTRECVRRWFPQPPAQRPPEQPE